jgi:hypothetical protein
MKKVFKGIGVFFLIVLSLIILSIVSSKNEPPPMLRANVVDMDNITKISKFRSCAGHVTVPQSQEETKRSMKHYYWVKPELVGTDAVKIYSPYDGYISDVRSDPEEHLEGEVWIIPKRAFPILPPLGIWQFSVQHIIVREDLRRGSEVNAGDVIGHAAVPEANRASFDVVYAKQALVPKMIDNWNSPFAQLDSVFNHMSEEVFSQYQSKGIVSRDELITTREVRDSKPCQYQGEGPYFSNQEDLDNWAFLK